MSEATICAEQEHFPGQEFDLFCGSPKTHYAVVFTDEGKDNGAAYFYALDFSIQPDDCDSSLSYLIRKYWKTMTKKIEKKNFSTEGIPVVNALHIYNVNNVVDKNISSKIQVVWSSDGLKALLLINNHPHAAFDFKNKKGYSLTLSPPPLNDDWVPDSSWDDDQVWLLFNANSANDTED